ncbi:hypothetical protein [Acidithiobacillus marinus]|nr:hypothetical protein [Acidithiobacillus marinus]
MNRLKKAMTLLIANDRPLRLNGSITCWRAIGQAIVSATLAETSC